MQLVKQITFVFYHEYSSVLDLRSRYYDSGNLIRSNATKQVLLGPVRYSPSYVQQLHRDFDNSRYIPLQAISATYFVRIHFYLLSSDAEDEVVLYRRKSSGNDAVHSILSFARLTLYYYHRSIIHRYYLSADALNRYFDSADNSCRYYDYYSTAWVLSAPTAHPFRHHRYDNHAF